jgi:hypothetical protein
VNEWNKRPQKKELQGYTKMFGKELGTNLCTEDYTESVKKVLDDALLGKGTPTMSFHYLPKTTNVNSFIRQTQETEASNGDTYRLVARRGTRAAGELAGC